MPRHLPEIDTRRIIAYLFCFSASAASAAYFRPFVSGNESAVLIVVTIFSVLAGFIVAIIALIAESAVSRFKTREELVKMRRTIENQLFRQKVLFYLYLLCLGLAFCVIVIPNSHDAIKLILEYFFIFISTFSFFLSFSIPGALIKLQKERYEAAVQSKRPSSSKD